MALKGPTKEDLGKLHSEVNQIVNQRFILTTFAVTIFGIMLAWVIPKVPPEPSSDLGWFPFLVSILTMVVLSLLFSLMHALLIMLRIFSSYLITTESSDWEKDWLEYRKSPYFDYTKAQSVVFLVLGPLAASTPFFLKLAYNLNLAPLKGALTTIVLAIIYVVYIYILGFNDLGSMEKASLDRWEGLK